MNNKEAFDAGFKYCATEWAERDDLIPDMDSDLYTGHKEAILDGMDADTVGDFKDSKFYQQGLAHSAVGKALSNPNITLEELSDIGFDLGLEFSIGFKVI